MKTSCNHDNYIKYIVIKHIFLIFREDKKIGILAFYVVAIGLMTCDVNNNIIQNIQNFIG